MKVYCKYCNSMQEVSVIGEITSERLVASCCNCNNKIEITRKDVFTKWRKVENGDTSTRRVK